MSPEDLDGLVTDLITKLAANPTALQITWFGLIAVLWIGYVILEGFDFGVGMLFPFLSKNDRERRAMLTTIGPLWDGNEVWLLTAGGATFAAFPEWYATLFSAAYLPLFLILLALIVRAVGFEYRGKIDSDRWRRNWDLCISIGSWAPAILWGVAFSDLVAGVPARVNALQVGPSKILFDGNFFDLVKNPFVLVGGATTCLLFLALGALFTSLKTTGELRQRATALAPKLVLAATVVAAVWAVWLQLAYSNNTWSFAAVGVAAVALVLATLTTLKGRIGLGFTFTSLGLLGGVTLIFSGLYPNVINASRIVVDTAGDLLAGAATPLPNGTDLTETLANDYDITGLPIVMASSSPGTLKLMTIVACILVPFVLAYQAWSIWVFRKRISADRIPAESGLAPAQH